MSAVTWAQIVFAAGVVFFAGGAWVRHQRHGQEIKELKDERDYHADCLNHIFRIFNVEPPERRPK